MKHSIHIVRGVPGSGKSTYAKKLLQELDPEKTVLIARDDIRTAFGQFWVEGRYDFDKGATNAIIRYAIEQDKYNIILEACYIDKESVGSLLEMIEDKLQSTDESNITVHNIYCDFHTCWSRNEKRPQGRKVPYEKMITLNKIYRESESTRRLFPVDAEKFIVTSDYYNYLQVGSMKDALIRTEGKKHECILDGDKCKIV